MGALKNHFENKLPSRGAKLILRRIYEQEEKPGCRRMVLALSDQLRNRGTPSAKSGEGGQCVDYRWREGDGEPTLSMAKEESSRKGLLASVQDMLSG